MDGVFGMLGFGSEADIPGDSLREVDQDILGQLSREPGPHTPTRFDLPPSSPPPETPAHHEGRTADVDRDSQLETPSEKARKKALAKPTPAKDSPLVRAFELARTRSKAGPRSSASRALSSPVAAPRLEGESQPEDSRGENHGRGAGAGSNKVHTRSQSVANSVRPRRVTRSFRSPASRAYSSPRRSKDAESECVGSSDVEEQEMEMEARRARASRASPMRSGKGKEPAQILGTPPRKRGYVEVFGKDDFHMHGNVAETPSREERLPSSVSPSPTRFRARSPSPLPLVEDTQTQEEPETPWESIRPSQSVSQVLERRVIEEAMAEAERGRLLREEQEAERQRAKEREEEEARMKEVEAQEEERQREEEMTAAKNATAVKNINPDQTVRAPVLEGLPARQLAIPPNVSTPKSRRIVDKEIYIVTPTKIVKRTPIRAHRDRVAAMTPSSPLQEEEGDDDEYTYVDETFNPTESQRMFLDRIMNASSEAE